MPDMPGNFLASCHVCKRCVMPFAPGAKFHQSYGWHCAGCVKAGKFPIGSKKFPATPPRKGKPT